MQADKYLTAIIYTEEKQVNGSQFLKYRNIENTQTKIANFCKFAARFPGAVYINFYYKDSQRFKERIHLQ